MTYTLTREETQIAIAAAAHARHARTARRANERNMHRGECYAAEFALTERMRDRYPEIWNVRVRPDTPRELINVYVTTTTGCYEIHLDTQP